MPLPRILLISSEAPHTDAAGAIVFHRLFRDYPADRLLVVTNTPPPTGATLLACRYATVRLLADRLLRTRFWPWRAVIRVLGGTRLVSLRRIDRTLEGFQPDIVATLMQDSWYYDVAARYARQRGLPLWLFIHDLPMGFEPVPPALRAWQRQRDFTVYREARARLCISEGMVAYFREQAGLPGTVLLPPRSDRTPAQDPAACRTLKHTGRLTLGYAGGLHYGYGEQLLKILPVLRATGTRLEICGPRPTGIVAALADATDVLTFHGYAPLPEQAWQTLLDRCDAIIQPYLNPPDRHSTQYRTHFPSKLGDCLSLGLPLLITGPEYASGVAWCRRHPGTALIVDDPSPAALMAAIHRLTHDAELRVSLAARAREAASTFDAPTLRSQFYQRLSERPAAPTTVSEPQIVECRVPTYRRTKLLARALRSLRAQTHPHWRAIVLDDSPGAEARGVVAGFGDPRIEYRANPVNLGAAGNLDQAFSPDALAGGQLACVLEDDNALNPRFMERALALMAASGHSILTFNQRIIDFRHDPDGQATSLVHPHTQDESWTTDRILLQAFVGKSLPNGGYFWRIGAGRINLQVGGGLRDAQLQEYIRQLRINQRILLCHEPLSDWSLLPDEDLRRTVINHRTFAANLNQLCLVLIDEVGLPRLNHLIRSGTLPGELNQRYLTILTDLSLLSRSCRFAFWRNPSAAVRAFLRLPLYSDHSQSSLQRLINPHAAPLA